MTQTDTSATESAAGAGSCPVAHITWEGPERPAMAGYEMLDTLQAESPIHRVDEGMGFYLITGHEAALMVAQNPTVFPQGSRILSTGDPQPFLLVPHGLNGPVHQKWRRLLAPFFTPGQVQALDGKVRARAIELIEGLQARGKCDYTSEFALRFPTAVFLELMGLPIDELDMMLEWETNILHPDYSEGGAGVAGMHRAQQQVTEYFTKMIAERRAMAREERPEGLATEALDWTIDGEPVTDADLLSFYLLFFMAGLDTVTAELGYGLRHLATHPEHRRRLVEEPELIPKAAEELLRAYSIVNTARDVAEDTEVAGCPVRKGDVVIVSFPAAGRDDNAYENAKEVDFDRPVINHLAFGAGPHRCLGSHLARHELVVAYEEWHKRIPEYRLDEDAQQLEASGGMMTLNTLPLTWAP